MNTSKHTDVLLAALAGSIQDVLDAVDALPKRYRTRYAELRNTRGIREAVFALTDELMRKEIG